MLQTALIDLIPPQGVDHILEAQLSPGSPPEFLCIRSNIIQVYSLQTATKEENKENSLFGNDEGRGAIRLEGSYNFAGPILAIERIRVTNDGTAGDKFLIAFNNFNFAVVEYQWEVDDFVTLSLHSFTQREEARRDGVLADNMKTMDSKRIISIDEDGRYALMKINKGYLGILPLRTVEGEWRGRQSILLPFNQINESIKNVIDFIFLPGFLEPTVAILFEPLPSWSYRYPEQMDTIRLMIFTVTSLAGHSDSTISFTLLSEYEGLPSDLRRIQVIGGSGGGIFLVGTNVLLHIDPTHPSPIGVALNSYASSTTRLGAIRRGIDFKCTLEAASFIPFQLSSSMSTAASSYLVSTDQSTWLLCSLIRDGGSRRIEINSSLSAALPKRMHDLGRVKKMDSFMDGRFIIILPILGDLIVMENFATAIAGSDARASLAPFSKLEIDDDLYNSTIPSSVSSVTATNGTDLQFFASITVLGPINDFSFGKITSFPSPSPSPSQNHNWKILACAGSSHSSILITYCGHIPASVDRILFKLSDCQVVFSLGSVIAARGKSVAAAAVELFLATTRVSSLLLMRRGEMVEEVPFKRTSLQLGEPTIFSSQIILAGYNALLQVTSNQVSLHSPDASTKLCYFSISDGDLIASTPGSADGGITSVCTSAIHLNLLALLVNDDQGQSSKQLLILQLDKSFIKVLQVVDNILAFDIFDMNGTPILNVITSSGSFSLSKLGPSEQSPIFFCSSFKNVPLIATNELRSQSSLASVPNLGGIYSSKCIKNKFGDIFFVIADSLAGLIFYRMKGERLLRLSSSSFPQVLRGDPSKWAFFCYLDNGVVAHNNEMALLISCDRTGWIRTHVLPIFGPIRSLSLFVSPNNGSGKSHNLLAYEEDGSVREVGVDINNFCLDAALPFSRSILEGELIKSIVYHSPSKSYATICLKMEPFTMPKDDYASISDNIEMALPVDAMLPKQARYTLRLFSFEGTPSNSAADHILDEFALDEHEYATCLSSSLLDTKQTQTGKQSFLVLGTSNNKGEDRPTRGRILIFDVVSIVPDPAHPHRDRRLKQLVSSDMKAPVTALSQLNGNLVVGVGPKVIVHSFENNEDLTGIAFVDTGVYATSIAVVKNYFLVGDVCKSLSLHAFQPKPTKVVTLARDFENRLVLATDFIIRGGEVTMVAGDGLGHVHLYTFTPTSRHSEGGSRLIHRGSINIGSDILTMKKLRMGSGYVDSMAQGTAIARADGGISLLIPIEEEIYRRLYTLQSRLSMMLPLPGGISSRLARQVAVPLINRPVPLPRDFIDISPVSLLRLFDLPLPARTLILEATRTGMGEGEAASAIATLLFSVFSLF